jgi:hypothetical protein
MSPPDADVERQAVGGVPGVLREERLPGVLARQVVAVAVGVVRRPAVVVEGEAVVVAVPVARRAALDLGPELQLVAAELVRVVGEGDVGLIPLAVGVVEPALGVMDQTGFRRSAPTRCVFGFRS